jgi:hypothetical protein
LKGKKKERKKRAKEERIKKRLAAKDAKTQNERRLSHTQEKNVLAVTKFIKTHPIKIGFHTIVWTVVAWKLLCIRKYNRIGVRSVQLTQHFICNVLPQWKMFPAGYL